MRDEADTRAYLNAELDKFQAAIDHRDKDGAWRVLEHVRAEAGDQVADIFTTMLADRGLSSLLPPPAGPPAPPSKRSIELPAPGSNKRLVIVLSTIVAALTVAVVVLVVVQVTRPTTATTVTTQPQVTTSVVVPAAPSAGETSATTTVAPPPVGPGFKLDIQRQPLTLGAPNSFACSTVADLDIPAVRVEGTLNDSTDLAYQCYPLGLYSPSARYFGNGPLEQPASAEQCAASARTETVSTSLEPKQLEPGKSAFCVVTHGGNVAWLRLGPQCDSEQDPASVTVFAGHRIYWLEVRRQFAEQRIQVKQTLNWGNRCQRRIPVQNSLRPGT
jgi:hypothetical protein